MKNTAKPRANDTIPTSFDKERVKSLDKTSLIRFYWKVVNALSQDATTEEHQTHDNNIAYLVSLLGYDPICE
jgi:hypothetical protein